MHTLRFFRLFLLCCSLFLTTSVFGQTFFRDINNFTVDLQQYASQTRNSDFIDLSAKFTTLWDDGTLSEEAKNHIYRSVAEMKRRELRIKNEYVPFLESILAINTSGYFTDDAFLSYLAVVDTSMHESGAAGIMTRFFTSVKQLAEERTIYAYNNNALYVERGDFKFGFGREGNLKTMLEERVDEVIGDELIPEDTTATTEGTAADSKTETSETSDDGWGSSGDSGGSDDGWGDPWESDSSDDDGGWGSVDDWDDGTGGDDGWGSTDGWGFAEAEVEEDAFDTTPEPVKPKDAKPEPGSKPDPKRFDEYVEIPGVVKRAPLVGPYIKLDSADLKIKTAYDEVVLRNTSGAIMYQNSLFVGKGGTFDWEVVGLPKGEAYVEFDEYTFSAKNGYIKARDVFMNYDKRLKGQDSVRGVFEFRSVRRYEDRDPNFPRFQSYYPDYSMDLQMDGVTHFGGFSMIGTRVTGKSYGLGVSTITVERGDSVRFVAKSRLPFVIRGERITNKRSELIIYRDKEQKDSIYHRAVQLYYNNANNVLKAKKDPQSYKYARFQDSYHMTTVLADYLKWDIEEDTMNVSMLQGRGVVPAEIESVDRFNEPRFDNLQGLGRFHPLVMAYNFGKECGSSEFSSINMYEYFKKEYPKLFPKSNIRNQLPEYQKSQLHPYAE
ncbi:MAG: hypothetical protein AAF740_04965, partial [Bacteroidota bacterium]